MEPFDAEKQAHESRRAVCGPRAAGPGTRGRRRIRQWCAVGASVAGLAMVAAACGSTSSSSAPTSSTSSTSSTPSSVPTSASTAPTSTTPTSTTKVSSSAAGKPTIVLGDKNFEEEYVLGYLYADAFKAKGYKVVLEPNIGGSSLINRVFQAGKINAYPEYLGEIAATDAGYNKPLTSEAQTLRIAQAYEKAHGATVMTPVTPFYDTDEVVVLKSFAEAHHLTKISQLKGLGKLEYCDYPSEENRYEGFLGLKESYGLTNLVFVPISPGLQYKVLDDGQCQAADAFSTDPELLSGKYTVLTDTHNIFGFQHVGMVIKTSLLDALGPNFDKIYTQVTDLLTTTVMQTLNKAVAIDKDSPQAVANAFLKANNLLG
jgi:osmoprotectant transport system substrate-binding protein